jgi:hypothetical protein
VSDVIAPDESITMHMQSEGHTYPYKPVLWLDFINHLQINGRRQDSSVCIATRCEDTRRVLSLQHRSGWYSGSALDHYHFLPGSRYSAVGNDWIRAGRLRGRSSNPGRIKNFHFFTSSRPGLGFTQPPIQWVPGGCFLGG